MPVVGHKLDAVTALVRQDEVILGGVAGIDHAEGEEFLRIGALFGTELRGISEQERFALPAEPQILIQPLGIDSVIQLNDLIRRLIGIIHIQHGGDLRRFHAVGTCLRPDLAQRQDGADEVFCSVGVVEEHDIHPGVCQKLCVLAQNPAVDAVVIVAEQRLVPETGCDAAPRGVVVITDGFGVFGDDFAHVDNVALRFCQRRVPCVVEQPDIFSLTDAAGSLAVRQCAPQPVGCRPCTGADKILRIGRGWLFRGNVGAGQPADQRKPGGRRVQVGHGTVGARFAHLDREAV